MATITTTTTAVELENFDRTRSTHRDGREHGNQETDNVMQASRLVDMTVPEGGYGWVVIFACAILSWWSTGTAYCWGVFQSALAKEGLGSSGTLAFVGSLSPACVGIFATTSTRLIQSLGARYSALLAIVFIGAGELLSGFAVHNVAALFITAGLLPGIGVSICFMIFSAMSAQYFSRKRGLANGIISAGGGLGGTVTSFAIDALVNRLGIAWAYRVVGFITLAIGLPAAWLVKERTRIRNPAFVEWGLFRDSKFVIIFIAGAVATFPLYVPPFFLPLYSASIGLSSSTGAGLVAGFNFASAVGRIGCGLLCDVIGPLNAVLLSLALSAVSMLALWPVSDTLAPMVVFAIVNGAANGGFFATMPTVVGNVFGSARVSVAMAMIVTSWTFGYLLGAPIAGFMLDAYGGEQGGLKAFRPAIFYAGSMALGATGLALLARMRVSMKFLVKV